ncbi:MAG: IS1 family transposase, partial [Ruminococcus sp.]|nr:IS1 family transposase [Ruminococcus sp.]
VLIRGKKNTQKIERNHLTLRTRLKRLARKTICFSKDKDIQRINYTATSPQVSHLIKQNKKCVVTCFRNNALS